MNDKFHSKIYEISGFIYAVFLSPHCLSSAERNITKTGDGHQNQQVHYAKLYVHND